MKQPLIVSSLVVALMAASGYSIAAGSSSDRSTGYSGSSGTSSQSGTTESGSGSSSAGQFIDDATVTTRVKSRLAADEKVSAMDVGVETNNGIVQLSGFVGSESEKMRAEEIARQVPDVRSVNNGIIVQREGASGTGDSMGGSSDRPAGTSGESGGTGDTGTGGSSRY